MIWPLLLAGQGCVHQGCGSRHKHRPSRRLIPCAASAVLLCIILRGPYMYLTLRFSLFALSAPPLPRLSAPLGLAFLFSLSFRPLSCCLSSPFCDRRAPGLSAGPMARAVAARRPELPGAHLRCRGVARRAGLPQRRLALFRRSAMDVRWVRRVKCGCDLYGGFTHEKPRNRTH